MKTEHGRKLGLVGVALTKARNNKHDVRALAAVRDEFEKILIETNYFAGAPFSWVTIAIRYGLVDAEAPTYQRISKKYGDLPLAIEVDSRGLTGLDEKNLADVFQKAVAKALVHAGRKFKLPTSKLEEKHSAESKAPGS